MARELKPQKMGEIWVKNSNEILILYLDRNTKDFFCDVHGEIFRSKTFQELESKISTMAKTLVTLQWIPVIAIRMLSAAPFSSSDLQMSAAVSVEIDRYWIAKSARGGYIKADWDTEEKFRGLGYSQMYWNGCTPKDEDKLLPRRSSDKTYNYLEYSETLWQGLLRFIQVLHETRVKVLNFISDPVALLEIQKVGSLLLLTSGEN